MIDFPTLHILQLVNIGSTPPPLGSAPGIPPVPVEEFRRDHLWSSSSPKERINNTVMHLMMLATVLQV